MEAGLGSLNDQAGILKFSLTPTLMMSLVRTRILQAGAGVLYTLSADRLRQSGGLINPNKVWFTQGNLGLFAEVSVLFGPRWSLDLGWQYSLPLVTRIDASHIDSGTRDAMGITRIEDSGLRYHSINLRLYLYR